MNTKGFTLLELVTTVAIGAILMGLAIPSFRTFVQNARLSGATSDLLAAIHLARTEAVKRGDPILLCRTGSPGADPGSLACRAAEPDGSANGTKDWTPGWVMYAKPGYTGSGGSGGDYNNGADGDPVALGDPAPAGVTIRTNQAADQWLAFYADGTLNETVPALYAVCDDRGIEFGRAIHIPRMGRPYVTAATTCNP